MKNWLHKISKFKYVGNSSFKLVHYLLIVLIASCLSILLQSLPSYSCSLGNCDADEVLSHNPESKIEWMRPFQATSIWNTPLGRDAVYKSVGLKAGIMTMADVELLYQVTADDPLTRLYAPKSWHNRCGGTESPTGNSADEIYLRFPKNKLVADVNSSETPNNVASILQPNGRTIVAVAPLARCVAGGAMYGWYFGEENLYGKGITGGHGGSGLSGIGGTIRLGELTNNQPINHALKINVWGNKYLKYDKEDSTPGYRWPASKTDTYADKRYGGTNRDFEMGSLLAIPPDKTPENIGIKTIPALKLFHALQNYGAYVVDDSAWDVAALGLQEGVIEEFKQDYGYQFKTQDRNSQWFKEYYALIEALHVIANNSPNSIGGGGARIINPN